MLLLPGRRAAAVASVALALWQAPVAAQASSEPAVKAGFVYNFAKFTEWPAAATPGPQIALCLVGNDPLGAVASLLDGKPLQGRSIVVRRNVHGDDLKSCAIVYITDVDERRQADALRALQGAAVLTIGDAEGFLDAGGVVGLVTADDRVQFEVNLESAQRAGLKINSQVLRLARSVKGKTP